MGPLEFLVLRKEFLDNHPTELVRVFAFCHFLSLHQYNISINAFTSHITVESLGKVLFNALPALWVALFQVLVEGY